MQIQIAANSWETNTKTTINTREKDADLRQNNVQGQTVQIYSTIVQLNQSKTETVKYSLFHRAANKIKSV